MPEVCLKMIPVMQNHYVDLFERDIANPRKFENIKQLLADRLIPSNFIHSVDGWTPLNLAINYQRFDVCKVLLDAGADPFVTGRGIWARFGNPSYD